MIGYVLLMIFYILVNGNDANTNYKITFFTGPSFTAGTNANVFVKLYGETGTSKDIKIKSKWSSFRPGKSDSFKINAGANIGEIKKIYIYHDDSFLGAGWHLVKVFVQQEHSNKVVKFYVDKWLDDDLDDYQLQGVEVTTQDKDKCGIASSPRIVNGKSAARGQWPWQAQIKVPIYDLLHHCGGTLIHPQYILTAAHCIGTTKPENFIITMGEHDLLSNDGTEQRFSATKLIVHPGWNDKNFQNDIALIKLNKPVILNANVKTVCLPEFGYQLPAGEPCYITGWGRLFGHGIASRELQQASFPSADPKNCSKALSYIVPVTSNMVCGGGNGKAACNGDSGGPFVCPNESGRWVVQGAVSWGKKLCPTDTYTVFTRISQYVDWIESQIYCKYRYQ